VFYKRILTFNATCPLHVWPSLLFIYSLTACSIYYIIYRSQRYSVNRLLANYNKPASFLVW
jgi:hypothetical protein